MVEKYLSVIFFQQKNIHDAIRRYVNKKLTFIAVICTNALIFCQPGPRSFSEIPWDLFDRYRNGKEINKTGERSRSRPNSLERIMRRSSSNFSSPASQESPSFQLQDEPSKRTVATNADSTPPPLFNPLSVHNTFLHLCTRILGSFINIESLIKAWSEPLRLLQVIQVTSSLSFHLISIIRRE